MILFFSKSPETKEQALEERKFRDLKSLIHKQHAAAMSDADEEASKSVGYQEQSEEQIEDGIDQDFASKVGRQHQKVKELMHERSKLFSRRKSIKKSRSRLRRRGKSLGLG